MSESTKSAAQEPAQSSRERLTAVTYVNESISNEMILTVVNSLIQQVNTLSDDWGPQFNLSATRTGEFSIDVVEFRFTTTGFIK